MTVGDKIKKIRIFRNMTQKELAERIGLGENGANRIAQYETNYRVPKQELLNEMAKALDVNPENFSNATRMSASDFMITLFWIDEFNPSAINLFSMDTFPGERCNTNDDPTVYYHDTDCWPAKPPIGMWINYGLVNQFLKEWAVRKQELKNGYITKDEYFEWKVNWPRTCDECGKRVAKREWRTHEERLHL